MRRQHQFLPFAAVALAIGLGFVCAKPTLADDQEDNWFARDYPYSIVDQALEDVLREFGHNLRLTVEVSDGVKGRVRNYSHEGTSGELLAHLAREYGLDWVMDGQRLYMSSDDERMVRSWSGNAEVVDAANAALRAADLDVSRFPLDFDSTNGTLRLSAPPRHMTLAASTIDRLLSAKPARTVNVIHGRSRDGGT
jgi:type III secretion protein C